MELKTIEMKPSVYIETYGCQMNKYDTELVSGLLINRGYRLADSCEAADIVLINTCSVREHAEKRVLGRISVLSSWKKQAAGRKLGIIGCMSQRMGADLLKKRPYLDLVVGPDSYRNLPEILNDGLFGPCLHTRLDQNEIYSDIHPERESAVSGWIAISRGCNNFCSYCIVPFTRGHERSRPAADILSEVEHMAEQGYRELTFLGQNVNSYHDGKTDFADLLRQAARVKGILRIRFMTSHPKDLSDPLLEVISGGGKICPHIHLPVQSGSNRILKAMNRGYTREHYLVLIDKTRQKIPGVAISSDILVAFPGETRTDFEETCNLVQQVRFDEAYTYAYSKREGTKAAQMPEILVKEEKRHRLDSLIQLQRSITLELKRSMIGLQVEVLPEQPSRRSKEEWMGRTPTNHVVVFPKTGSRSGEPLQILIEKCNGATLWGKIAFNTKKPV